uniref:Uncharacterized protein n=1 Tax=Calcidiscus leptoporus TaxID=127549 RepID=A0A7S0ITV6_9EUKA
MASVSSRASQADNFTAFVTPQPSAPPADGGDEPSSFGEQPAAHRQPRPVLPRPVIRYTFGLFRAPFLATSLEQDINILEQIFFCEFPHMNAVRVPASMLHLHLRDRRSHAVDLPETLPLLLKVAVQEHYVKVKIGTHFGEKVQALRVRLGANRSSIQTLGQLHDVLRLDFGEKVQALSICLGAKLNSQTLGQLHDVLRSDQDLHAIRGLLLPAGPTTYSFFPDEPILNVVLKPEPHSSCGYPSGCFQDGGQCIMDIYQLILQTTSSTADGSGLAVCGFGGVLHPSDGSYITPFMSFFKCIPMNLPRCALLGPMSESPTQSWQAARKMLYMSAMAGLQKRLLASWNADSILPYVEWLGDVS